MPHKKPLLAISLLGVFAAGVTWAQGWQRASVSLGRLKDFHRVTEEPYPMRDTTVIMCMAPTQDNPHRFKVFGGGKSRVEQPPPRDDSKGFALPVSHYCHVYVNDAAKPVILSGEGEYPVGSQVIKAKLTGPKSENASLYTAMRKREAGYDPEHGDWEYSVLDQDGVVLAIGRIDSCIDCHQGYQETDFVTRTYLAEPLVETTTP